MCGDGAEEEEVEKDVYGVQVWFVVRALGAGCSKLRQRRHNDLSGRVRRADLPPVLKRPDAMINSFVNRRRDFHWRDL